MINKIVLPTNPQPDTIVAVSLLKIFGREKYPGIENAPVEILSDLPESETPNSLEEKGTLCIDLREGKFDHHGKNTTASNLVALDLGILEYTPIAKLLAYAERDDKFGRGTLSEDPLDRAFGLSGLISVLNKAFPNNPNDVVNYVLPLVWAHFVEEKKRVEEIPAEFEKKLDSGEVKQFEVRHKGDKTKIVIIQSDNPSMIGWLRSSSGVKADVVAQKTNAGYVNILTRQFKRIDLRLVASLIRKEETELRGRRLGLSSEDLMRPGRVNEVPEWYYDRATNSLLNGSLSQKGISPTQITLPRIKELIEEGLSSWPPKHIFPELTK